MSMRMSSTRKFTLLLSMVLGVISSGLTPVFSQPTEPAVEPAPIQNESSPEAELSKNETDADAATSDAERVAELQEAIEHDEKQLASLEQEMENPQSEYALADADFRAIKTDLDQTKAKLAEAKLAEDSVLVQKIEQDIASLERQRKLAEDRFDLAIEDRKTLREQRAILRNKIENDKAALAELTGENEVDEEEGNESRQHASSHSAHDHHGSRNKSHDDQDRDIESKHTSREDSDDEKKGTDDEENDEELKQAAAEAEVKEQEAEEAQQETQTIAARLADIQKLISQEQKELDLARKKVDLATASQLTLSQELSRREAEQADASDLSELRVAIGKASQRLIQARNEVTEISDRLHDHRAEQSSLQAEHIVALHEAEKKRNEAAAAENRVEALRNPFTFRNMLQWLIEHGPRLLLIVVGMFLVNRLASFFAQRSVRLVTTSSGRGSKVERENRAKTLVGVFQNAATVAIFVSGTLMMLEEVGANITVLMGGVAVIGLAVAFGAQNLIKDYFYGFVMLLENQYMLNDSVRIGGVAGQVERITLRMTVLRDSNGVVHFIPNGTINSVSNETHGWSRAVCEIAVGYRQDLDAVMNALRGISEDLRADSKLGPYLLEPPAEPSIDSLGESAILLKVTAKTQPNKHGAVKQEWLRRIKNRFDELGIQPPIQQRLIQVQADPQDDEGGSVNRAFHMKRAG